MPLPLFVKILEETKAGPHYILSREYVERCHLSNQTWASAMCQMRFWFQITPPKKLKFVIFSHPSPLTWPLEPVPSFHVGRIPHLQTLGRRQRPPPPIREGNPLSQTFLQLDMSWGSTSQVTTRWTLTQDVVTQIDWGCEECIWQRWREWQWCHEAARGSRDSSPSCRIQCPASGGSVVGAVASLPRSHSSNSYEGPEALTLSLSLYLSTFIYVSISTIWNPRFTPGSEWEIHVGKRFTGQGFRDFFPVLLR